MAEERDDSQRTEEPTQRRLDDAHKKGDVVKSSELSSFILLSGATIALAALTTLAVHTFARDFTMFLEQPEQLSLDAKGVSDVFGRAVWGLLAVIGPAAGVLMIAALFGNLVQHRPVWTTERLKPDFSKLSLAKGAKRLFGLDGITNLAKGVLKMALVGFACFLVLWPERTHMAATFDMSAGATATLMMGLVMKLAIASLVVLGAIAALDYIYQRQRFMGRNRMSRQELKEEIKQSEGDPQVRAKIRQIRESRARKRMIAAVPTATVVITNPTHYAVALKYESGKMAAPVCVAKGVDATALKIREVASEHEVPVVENPPLARALFAAVEVDDVIPPEHFKAVAGVIGYVMRLAEQKKYWRQ